MRHWGRTARRLTVASALALAMLTGGIVVGDPASGAWGSGGRGCGQRCALVPTVGYAPPLGGAHRRVGLARACRPGRPPG